MQRLSKTTNRRFGRDGGPVIDRVRSCRLAAVIVCDTLHVLDDAKQRRAVRLNGILAQSH